MSEQIHVGDIGTRLIVTVCENGEIVDISSASALTIIIRKPDGTSMNKIGILYTNGIDGKMYCTSVAGDFDMSGNYKIQGKVTLGGGIYYTSVGSFKVYCNI